MLKSQFFTGKRDTGRIGYVGHFCRRHHDEPVETEDSIESIFPRPGLLILIMHRNGHLIIVQRVRDHSI
jgi:hypothetical protein